MKITLILAAAAHDALRDLEPFMPLSLPLLAGAAPEHDYRFIDMLRSSAAIDYDVPADVVGISVRMTAEADAYAVADQFRRRGTKVVLGGPQASVMPHRAKAHADAVVVGEGEPLWPVVLEDLERGELKDYYVCSPRPFDAQGGTVFQLHHLPDLAEIATPVRHLFEHRYDFDTVFASRGCHVNCDFCSVPALFGTKTRLRPINAVVEEISRFKGFYYLIDDTVFGRPETYDYYLELYEAIGRLDTINLWHGQANLDAAASEKGREVIRRAARAGLLYAAVGLESINPVVLEKSGALRKMGVQNVDQALDRMREHIRFIQDQGILVSGWFVVGYEDDDIDTFYRSYEFCREMKIMPILSPVNALPGTRLWSRLEDEGVLDNAHSLTNLPHKTIRKEQVIEALDHCVRKGFSLKEILRRTALLARKLNRDNGNDGKFRIMKPMVAFQIQRNMVEVFLRENANLASDRSQNFVP